MKARIILLVVLLLITAVVVILAPKQESAEELIPPAVELPDGYNSANDFAFKGFDEIVNVDTGEAVTVSVPHSLGEYAGTPVVVTFWASWNTVSREQLDVIEGIYSDYDGVVFLPVNVGKAGKDSEKKARIAMADGEYTFPLYIDETGVVTFNITSTPKTFFFDGMGNLLAEVNGLCSAEVIADKTAELLK